MPAHIGDGEPHPAVMHVAALEPDGDIRVADLWDSAAAFGEFAGDADRPGRRRLDAADRAAHRPGLQPPRTRRRTTA